MIKIYSKTGDKGETSLLGGGRIAKSDIKVCAYGDVDELSSFIGLVIAKMYKLNLKNVVVSNIFNDNINILNNQVLVTLFHVSSWLLLNESRSGEKYGLTKITDDDVQELERQIDIMTIYLAQLKHFIKPIGNTVACTIHVARTVCRRAERSIVALAIKESINTTTLVKEVDPIILKYFNRLSDYLFTLARFTNFLFNEKEETYNTSS